MAYHVHTTTQEGLAKLPAPFEGVYLGTKHIWGAAEPRTMRLRWEGKTKAALSMHVVDWRGMGWGQPGWSSRQRLLGPT